MYQANRGMNKGTNKGTSHNARLAKGKSIVYYYDFDKNEQHYGVQLENDYIICLCCGGITAPGRYNIIKDNKGFAYLEQTLQNYF